MKKLVIVLGIALIAAVAMADDMAQFADIWNQSREDVTFNSQPLTKDDLPPSLTYHPDQDSWIAEKMRSISEFAASTGSPPGASTPFIMLAGYYDTDVTYAEGGTIHLIAYVMDPDGPGDIESVELYYEGIGTRVYLLDNGQSGDFGANDSVFGFQVPIEPNVVPPGQYTFELVAHDRSGNESDMWPYLTVHP